MTAGRWTINFYQTGGRWYWRIMDSQHVLADGFVGTADEAAETIEEWLRNYRMGGGFGQ